MSEVTGVVTKVFERTTKKDGTPLRSPSYSLQLDDNKNMWISCGFTHPGVTEGDVVTVNYNEGKFGKEVSGAIIAASKAAPAAKKAVISNDNRQESIVFQSCLKVSAEIVASMVTQDLLPLPKAANKRVDAVVSYTREIARDLAKEAIAPDLSAEPESVVPDDE